MQNCSDARRNGWDSAAFFFLWLMILGGFVDLRVLVPPAPWPTAFTDLLQRKGWAPKCCGAWRPAPHAG